MTETSALLCLMLLTRRSYSIYIFLYSVSSCTLVSSLVIATGLAILLVWINSYLLLHFLCGCQLLLDECLIEAFHLDQLCVRTLLNNLALALRA